MMTDRITGITYAWNVLGRNRWNCSGLGDQDLPLIARLYLEQIKACSEAYSSEG